MSTPNMRLDLNQYEDGTPAVDFMFDGYSLIKEPLNLEAGGQKWFGRIFREESRRYRGHGSLSGLVLGATPWLIGLLQHLRYKDVMVVEMSSPMIRLAKKALSAVNAELPGEVSYYEDNWLTLPSLKPALDAVIADNSLSFLRFPDDWAMLCDRLSEQMEPNGLLVTRCLSTPRFHRPSTAAEIVKTFMEKTSIKYTEVRASLLFSHCNAERYSIDTEQVLRAFEAERGVFEPLFRKFPITDDNDLLTISKYKDSGAVYYAPPLHEIVEVLERRFRVISIHYGEYSMREYFPLFVAVKK